MRILDPKWSDQKNACYWVRAYIAGIINYLELIQEGRNPEEYLKKAVESSKLAHKDVEELFQMIASADRS